MVACRTECVGRGLDCCTSSEVAQPKEGKGACGIVDAGAEMAAGWAGLEFTADGGARDGVSPISAVASELWKDAWAIMHVRT